MPKISSFLSTAFKVHFVVYGGKADQFDIVVAIAAHKLSCRRVLLPNLVRECSTLIPSTAPMSAEESFGRGVPVLERASRRRSSAGIFIVSRIAYLYSQGAK